MAEDILIIGAGIAGLAAARKLMLAGNSVRVFDKGRRIGGRVATRRADGFVFDHGAQFLTAHTDSFSSLCHKAASQGALTVWTRPNGKQAFIGGTMMRDFPSWLATLPDGRDIPIQQAVEIAQIIETDGKIHLYDHDNSLIAEGAQLIITAPAPQTERLLQDAAPELSQTAATATYDPCWTVMLGLKEADTLILPEIESPDSDLSFVADSRSRRPQTHTKPHTATDKAACLILQASADWSKTYLEAEADDIIKLVTALYTTHLQKAGLSMPEVSYQSAHRWRYAKLAKAADEANPRSSQSGRLHLAGDWLIAPRIESAFISGEAAADAVLHQKSRA